MSQSMVVVFVRAMVPLANKRNYKVALQYVVLSSPHSP